MASRDCDRGEGGEDGVGGIVSGETSWGILGNSNSERALCSLQSVGYSRVGQERIHMYPLIYVFLLCSLLNCFLPAFVNLAGVETVKTMEHYHPRMLESLW